MANATLRRHLAPVNPDMPLRLTATALDHDCAEQEGSMSNLRYLYLALAVWGTIHPMSWFISWFNENGYDLAAMIDAWHANAATSGLVWDLTIAAATLTLWVLAETWTRKNWMGLLAIPATFCIGVSCGLPLYLFLRSRAV